MAFIPALKYHFLTPIYDRFIGLTMPEKEVKNKVIQLLKIEQGERILDFGCGTGTLVKLLLLKHPNLNVIGLDVDQKVLQVARNKGIKNKDIRLFDGLKIPYENEYFDKITSTWVFHHLTNEQKINAFSEIKRVLRPKGMFVLADWGRPSNRVQRILFFILQVFDNFHTTSANVNGEMTFLMRASGFSTIREEGFRNTIFGTLRYWLIRKEGN